MSLYFFANKANGKQIHESGKTAFKMINISSARECCATWCSFSDTFILKTTDQMMLDIGGFGTEIEYLIITPFYGRW